MQFIVRGVFLRRSEINIQTSSCLVEFRPYYKRRHCGSKGGCLNVTGHRLEGVQLVSGSAHRWLATYEPQVESLEGNMQSA